MILSVAPISFEYCFRFERELIKEIIKVTDAEMTYTTYDNSTFTKKITRKTPVHHFFDGWSTMYMLEDGDTVETFNYSDFDWRNYPIDEVDEERAAAVGKMMKEGMSFPKIKIQYPSLLNSFNDGVSIKDLENLKT